MYEEAAIDWICYRLFCRFVMSKTIIWCQSKKNNYRLKRYKLINYNYGYQRTQAYACNWAIQPAAASIYFFKSEGSWIRVNKISIFQAKFREILIFSGNFTKNFDFRGIFLNFDFSGNCFLKIPFSRQKLLIYSHFWANYSISLQKSPLSGILPVVVIACLFRRAIGLYIGLYIRVGLRSLN